MLPGHQTDIREVSHLPFAFYSTSLPVCFACFFSNKCDPVLHVDPLVHLPLSRTVAIPLASLLGVSDKQRVCAAPNPTLESYFCSTSKHPTQVLLRQT